MTPTPEETDANLTTVEEGIPAANNGNNGGGARSVVRRQSSRLSVIGKKYDIDGDGKLDEAEQAMRDMDKEGLGYLPNDKVYTIFQEQLRMQKQLLMAKRIIIFCACLLIILAAANVGVSFAAANLAKDTSTNNNVLVVKESGEVVATNNHADVFGVKTADTRRRAQVIADGSTSTQQQSTISRADAQTMLADCSSGGTAHIARTWAGWENVASLNVNIPICPGHHFTGMPNGNDFDFILLDGRTLNITCPDVTPSSPNDSCVMSGTGIQQLAGEACAYDSDCCCTGSCVGADAATSTPGTCILPMDASGCQAINNGSDCETETCDFGFFYPPIFGYCTCNPTTDAGCTGSKKCYTGDEQGYPENGARCLLSVGSPGCSQDWDCLGLNVNCVGNICVDTGGVGAQRL